VLVWSALIKGLVGLGKPGTRYIDWGLRDPKGQPVDAVRDTRDEIQRRDNDLLSELDANP